MAQLVFLHGPGAGGCARSFQYQLEHFAGSLAPELPGHLNGGASCTSIEGYTEWVRGWLWAQRRHHDLVLVGFTLGSCIALQYALDYPDEVKGVVAMTVAMRPKSLAPEILNFRLRAAQDPVEHEKWIQAMRDLMHFIDPELREELIACHRKIGSHSQYRDLEVMEKFDLRDRIADMKTHLTLIRGLDDPLPAPEYEAEIHRAVAGSTFLRLHHAGHFPMAEQPVIVNRAIEELVASIPSHNG